MTNEIIFAFETVPCITCTSWTFWEIRGNCQYSCCFARYCFQNVFKTAQSFSCSFFSLHFLSVHVMLPKSTIDTGRACRRSCFILTVGNLSIAFNIFIYIYIYIVIHRQTVSFYQNSSVWLDTQDARSRDRNPSNFTLDCVSDHSSTKRTTLAKGILFLETAAAAFVYIFIPYRLPECSILSKSFALR